MTDNSEDLVRRLLRKSLTQTTSHPDEKRYYVNPDGPEAAARIQQLEDQLAGAAVSRQLCELVA